MHQYLLRPFRKITPSTLAFHGLLAYSAVLQEKTLGACAFTTKGETAKPAAPSHPICTISPYYYSLFVSFFSHFPFYLSSFSSIAPYIPFFFNHIHSVYYSLFCFFLYQLSILRSCSFIYTRYFLILIMPNVILVNVNQSRKYIHSYFKTIKNLCL